MPSAGWCIAEAPEVIHTDVVLFWAASWNTNGHCNRMSRGFVDLGNSLFTRLYLVVLVFLIFLQWAFATFTCNFVDNGWETK